MYVQLVAKQSNFINLYETNSWYHVSGQCTHTHVTVSVFGKVDESFLILHVDCDAFHLGKLVFIVSQIL